MIYPNFTLYPNGAFMMCESLSEFDQNVQPPVPSQSELKAVANLKTIDPVIETINKLKPVYDNIINPMLSDTYDIDSPVMAIDRFDRLIGDISDIVNKLRCTIVKLNAMVQLHENPVYGPTYESFKPYIGVFMKNVPKIQQQGFSTCTYSYQAVSAFSNFYWVTDIVNMIAANPVILEGPILGASIDGFLGSNGACSMCTQFEGFIDMIQCVFTDLDRLARLEETNTAKLSLNSIMSNASVAIDGKVCPDHDTECGVSILLKLMSTVCRDIAECCYEAICSFDAPTATTFDHDCMSKCLQTNLMKSVNLFALGVLVSMTLATRLRSGIACENAITEYTATLLNMLKSV